VSSARPDGPGGRGPPELEIRRGAASSKQITRMSSRPRVNTGQSTSLILVVLYSGFEAFDGSTCGPYRRLPPSGLLKGHLLWVHTLRPTE
jgi:hypothetical protein